MYVSPTQLVSVVGSTAVFSCPSSINADDSIVDIQWLLNGNAIYQVFNGFSVTVTTAFSDASNTGRLTLQNLSIDFNGAYGYTHML